MHIGIIPDGNRRWAEQHKLSREAGYAYGLKPGLLLLQQAKTYGIQEITYYGFTVDNCRRPKEQVQAFQQACVQAVHDLATEGVDLLVIGNTDSKCFPEELKICNIFNLRCCYADGRGWHFCRLLFPFAGCQQKERQGDQGDFSCCIHIYNY